MGLISSAKALWKKVKQKSQSSAQKAYQKKVQTERTQQRKHIVTSNYDKVRSRTTRTTTTSRSSGGSSSYSRPSSSGTTSWTSSQKSSSSTSPRKRQRKTSSSNTSGWSSYAQNTFKTSNKASQSKASSTSVPRTASGAIDWGKINSKGYEGTASKALKKAYEQGKGTNALGTKVKTEEAKYGNKKDTKIYQGGASTQPRSERRLYVDKKDKGPEKIETFPMVQTATNHGIAKHQAKKQSKQEKKAIDAEVERLEAQGYDIDEKAVKDLKKSVSTKKLTKQMFDDLEKQRVKRDSKIQVNNKISQQYKPKGNSGTLKSKQLTQDEYLKLQYAGRLGKDLGNKMLGDKLARKIGQRTAYSAGRNKAARISTGFMQGVAYGDVLRGGVGTYGKKANEMLKDVTESGSYNLGYGLGQMAGSIGTGSAAKSLVSAGAKAGAKAAAKGGAKTVAKKFAKNRLAEMAVEAPMNIADAAKMSMDENGKVDRNKLAKYMALNTGLTGGTGALMEGAAIKFTKNNADRLIHLQGKANKGTITKKEGQELKGLYDKLDNVRKDTARADSDIAGEGFRLGKNKEMEGIVERYRPDAEKRMQKAKDIKTYRDIKANEKARAQKKAEAAAQQFTESPEGQRAVTDARIKELDDRIAELRATEGTKKQKLKARKEADRLQKERNKLAQSAKADVSGKRYYATKEETNAASESIRENERKLAQLERRQSFSTDVNSPGYKKRQAKIDKLKAEIANEKEAVDKYTIGNTKGASKPVTAPKQTADVAPKADDVTVRTNDAMLPDAPKAEAQAEAPKKGASKPEADTPTEEPSFNSVELTAEDAPVVKHRVNQLGEYSNVDKAFKKSANNILDNAPDRAGEVNRLTHEYEKTGKDIAKYKKLKENSNNPKHIEQHEKKIKALEEQRNKLHGEMRNLEDTHVSRHDSGADVIKAITPQDGKKAAMGKLGKIADVWHSIRRVAETSLSEFERTAKATGDKTLMNAVNNVYLARNKAGAFISNARTSFNTRTRTGKCLNDIFKDAGAFESNEARADFNMYALLRHHIDRAGRGVPVFMEDGKALSIPDAKKAMEALEAKYDAKYGIGNGKARLETFSDELTEYSNDLLKYRLDAGLITKETYENTLRENPHYVPTYRIKEGDGGFVYEEANNVTLDSVLKAAKGGDAPIEDLYSQLYKITNDVVTNAEQNEMIKLYAKDMGFDTKKLAENVSIEDLEKARVKAGKDGTISFFVDGERVTLKANDQAVKGLREWNGDDYALLCNACAKFGEIAQVRTFKGLITDWNIAFGVRNGARDFQQALVNSKSTRWFVRSMPSAWHAIASKNNAYRKLYEANGGKFFVPSGDPKQTLDPTKTGLFEKIVSPIEAVNGAIEMNPRMCEFIGTINKEANEILKKQGKTLDDLKAQAKRVVEADKSVADADKAGAIEDLYAEMVCNLVGKDTVDRAMYNSADITLNFSRHGAWGKALNSGPVPYLNPSLQGLSKTVRLFSDGRADKALLNIGAKLGTFTVAPAVFNEVMMRNNRDYQDLNTRDKDTYFFIPIGDGKFIRVPKPRENAVLAEPFVYGLRYFFDKAQVGSIAPGEYSSKENWKQMWDTAWDNLGPVNPLDSNYLSPLWNTAHNKTWYGGSIESMSDQELPVKDRRDETTSAWAIAFTDSKFMKEFRKSDFAKNNPVGSFMASNLSPKKVDNLMDSYFGMIYDVVIKPTAASRNLGDNKLLPSKENVGNYFINQFIMDGVYSNKLAQSYYDKLDKLNEGAKDGERTFKASVYMNEYGYQAQDYSTARSAIFGNDKDFENLTPQEKQWFGRYMKKHQNDVYRAGAFTGEKDICGTFDDNFKGDPLRVMCRGLKKLGFEDKTGMMPEAKVLRTFTYTNADGKNSYADALDNFKESEQYKIDGREKGIKKFFNDTIRTRGLIGEAGGSRGFITWTGASLVAQERNLKSGDESHTAFAKAFGASDESLSDAKDYLGFYNLKDYTKTHKPLERMAMKEGKYLSDVDAVKQSIKLASKGDPDGAFFIEGEYVDMKQNPSRCIIADGMTSKEYNKWVDKYGLRSYSKEKQKGLEKLTSKSGNTYYKSSEEDVLNAIESDYGNRSNEFKAAMFEMFYPFSENPYGSVGDYSQKNDVGLHHDSGYGGYGYGRRGYGGYGGGWGGGYGGYGGGYGSSAGGKDWNTYVGEIFDMKETKLHDYTKPSELTEAYRRRARKKQMVNQKRKG